MENIREDEEIYLKDIELDDAYDLRYWKLYKDERLKGYNYGNFTELDCEIWFMNISHYRKRYFAVKKKDRKSVV